MNLVIILLVGFGLAIDVFAIAVAQGSVLRKIKLTGLIFMSVVLCGLQLLFVSVGFWFADIPHVPRADKGAAMIWSLVAATLFAAVGGMKLFYQHFRPEIPEEAGEFDFKRIFLMGASISIYTLFMGVALGLLMLPQTGFMILLGALTIAFTVCGVILGYRYGIINKKIYSSGGVMLVLAGAIMLCRYFIWLLL